MLESSPSSHWHCAHEFPKVNHSVAISIKSSEGMLAKVCRIAVWKKCSVEFFKFGDFFEVIYVQQIMTLNLWPLADRKPAGYSAWNPLYQSLSSLSVNSVCSFKSAKVSGSSVELVAPILYNFLCDRKSREWLSAITRLNNSLYKNCLIYCIRQETLDNDSLSPTEIL